MLASTPEGLPAAALSAERQRLGRSLVDNGVAFADGGRLRLHRLVRDCLDDPPDDLSFASALLSWCESVAGGPAVFGDARRRPLTAELPQLLRIGLRDGHGDTSLMVRAALLTEELATTGTAQRTRAELVRKAVASADRVERDLRVRLAVARSRGVGEAAARDVGRELDDAAAIARTCDEPRLVVLVEDARAAWLLHTGAEDAEAAAHRSRRLSEQTPGCEGFGARAAHQLGIAARRRGDQDSAIAWLEVALGEFVALDDSVWRVRVLGSLANAWGAGRSLDRALTAFEDAAAMAAAVGDLRSSVVWDVARSRVLHALGHPAEALAVVEAAETQARRLNIRSAVAYALAQRGSVVAALEDPAQALPLYREAAELHRLGSAHTSVAKADLNVALGATWDGPFDEAMDLAKRSAEALRRAGEPRAAAIASAFVCCLRFVTGDAAGAAASLGDDVFGSPSTAAMATMVAAWMRDGSAPEASGEPDEEVLRRWMVRTWPRRRLPPA